jgi:chitin disaccharide deacetylase
MKYLIVNADDFGASTGINRGILEVHRRGIVTSTSLMVTTPWSEAAAAALDREAPDLSVGLHADLTGSASARSHADVMEAERCAAELERQLARFAALTGRMPTHLDSHRNVHRDPRLLAAFLDVARRHRLPLREHCGVRYLSKFYGQWGGETHLEQISIDGLLRLVDSSVGDGVTELACHPGYADPDLRSSYAAEREAELETLCNPTVRRALHERQIQLISFRELGAPEQLAATQTGAAV